MTPRIAFVALLAAALLASAAATWGQGAIRRQPVHFAPGKSAASINGSLKADETIDYVLTAAAGQQLNVSLKSANASVYFNVLPPGSEEALFNGSVSGNAWSGTVVKDGDYAVRVYQMRNAARRDETAKFTLVIGVSGRRAEK